MPPDSALDKEVLPQNGDCARPCVCVCVPLFVFLLGFLPLGIQPMSILKSVASYLARVLGN